jgi:hypothetical protein
MTFSTIASAIAVALASFVPASCHTLAGSKSTPPPPAPGTNGLTSAQMALNDLNGTNCALGELTLTNHTETCVKIGQNKQCYFTTKMIDSRNAQITLALEYKEGNNKPDNLAVTQIVTKSDRPFEVALGNCSLSFTPHIVSE